MRERGRRMVRAFRVGAVSGVAVGALAVLAACTPVASGAAVTGSAGAGSAGTAACVEAPWPRVGPDGNIGSGALLGLDLRVNLAADGLTLSEPGAKSPSAVWVPISGGLLQGTSRQGERLTVTMPSGKDVTVALRWTDREIAVSAGYSPDQMLPFVSIQRYPTAAEEAYPVRYHDINEVGLPSTNPFPTWILWDDYANAAALTVTLEHPGTFNVRLPDGSSQSFPLGSDGLATFKWQGMTFESQAVTADEKNFGIRMKVHMVTGDEVAAPLDATLTGAEFCIPSERAPSTASAMPSAAAPPASPPPLPISPR